MYDELISALRNNADNEDFETFNDWYEGQDEFKITHWMPLPAPPEEE